MSDILDALNIIAGMTNNIADYKLTKDRLESAQQHELDLFNRKQQSQMDMVNINTTLNQLDDNLKLNREDVNLKTAEFNQAGQNLDEIIKLPEQFQTPGGSSVSSQQEENTFSSLSQAADVGDSIGETIQNQNSALKGTEFALNQIGLLEVINNNIAETANTDLLKQEDNVAVSLDDFQDLFKSEEFRTEFEDKLGFAFGKDDPKTKHIDESEIDIDALLYGGAKDRLLDISEDAKATRVQNEGYESIIKLNDAIEGKATYFVETDGNGKTVGRNLVLTKDKYEEMVREGASIYKERGVTTYDPDADEIDEGKIFDAKVKNLGEEFSGSLASFITNINKSITNLKDTEYVSTELQDRLALITNPEGASWQSPKEITLMVNAIEEELAMNLISSLGWGYDKTGWATIYPHLSVAVPEALQSSIQAEFRELVERRTLEDTQLYSVFEDGKLVKRGIVDIVLGRHKYDPESGAPVDYQPGPGGVDKWASDYLDLGGIWGDGPVSSYKMIRQMALTLDHIRTNRLDNSDIIGPNNLFNVQSQYPVVMNPNVDGEEEFWEDFNLNSSTGAERRRISNEFNFIKDFEVTDENKSVNDTLNLDKKTEKKKTTSSASDDNLLNFANIVTSQFIAKQIKADAGEYWSGTGASSFSGAARRYRENPNDPEARAEWLEYYKKYSRK